MPEVLTPEQEWQPGQDQIRASYSSLQLHRKCPQAWFYRYELGLRRPESGPAPYMHFGSWWGAMRTAEALERGRKFGSLKVPPRKYKPVDDGPEFDQATMTPQDVYDAADEWWAHQDQSTLVMWEEALGEHLPQRLHNLNVRWMDEHDKENQTRHPVGVEIAWERALPRPDGDGAWETSLDAMEFGDGYPPVVLFGYIDQAYWDDRRGMIVCSDDKSMKTLAQQTSLDDMMDSQLQLYSWGVLPLFQKLGIEAPKAVGYDRVKSVAPTKPQLTLAGSLSKSVTMFDARTYADWAKGEDGQGIPWGKEGEYVLSGPRKGEPKFGFYTAEQAEIDKRMTPAFKAGWFQRTTVPLSRNIVRAHLRAAVDTATDINRTMKRGKITQEAARNLTKDNCRSCDYQSLNRAQMVGGPEGEYDLREHNLVGRKGLIQLTTIR